MKDLYIIPECYIDTNLVETLITTEGCNHQKGCNTVFSEIAHTASLSLKKHQSKPHYLIMVSPAMDGFLLKCAEELNINMKEYGYTSCLKERVAILIDEYDKPLLQAIGNPDLQREFRNTLKPFYGVLKTMDGCIKFALLTGVTKFGKVSVFSDLNNLDDITMREPYVSLCGITE